MASLADVFRVLEEMRAARVFTDYAIGGATAVLFYAEPTRTYDLDVFVSLPSVGAEPAPLSGVYEWTRARGFTSMAAHVMIHGVPVQFLPTPDALAGEAIREARDLDYDGVNVRVIDPEHLVALALQAGGARRRERSWQLFEAGQIDRDRLRELLSTYSINATIPDDV
jgi:hypothetical protein